MDFEDRDIGSEERFSGLSEGQRYALALVLNLAFVGVVIAGFAFLYTGGFGGGAPDAPASVPAAVEEREDEPAPVRLAAAEPNETFPLGLPEEPASEIETASLEPAAYSSAEPRAAAPTANDGAGGPSVAGLNLDALEAVTSEPTPEADVDPASASEDASDETETLTLAALEAPPTVGDAAEPAADVVDAEAVDAEAAAEEEPVEAEEAEATPPSGPNLGVVATLEPTPRVAPRQVVVEASSDSSAAASAIDPVAAQWSTAGLLATELQRQFPCSQFSLQADNAGRPSLRARVGFSDDIDLVRARVAAGVEDSTDVERGLGCTTVIGGGYVGLSDQNGQLALFDSGGLSREIRAVLPTEGACALIGQVVATQPPLARRLSAAGRQATWVRSGGEPALCELNEEGMWQVTSGRNAGDRQAAALVLGDDVLATEARRAASTTAPPAVEEPVEQEAPAAAVAPAFAAATQTRAQTPPAYVAAEPVSIEGLTEVAAVQGPSPALPAGTPAAPDGNGYAVGVAFTVDPTGRAQDLSVIGAGAASVSVVAAALENVSASRFPATGEAYRASTTVRFPTAEFMDLLTRLSLATAAERNAEPLWDRSPSQADYDRHYPSRALSRNIDGEAVVDCQIAFDGRLTCSVASEAPSGWGFGSAALSLAGIMRAAPRMSDGGPSANETVQVEFLFNSSDSR